ncbi:hypothetical protein [Chitinophaga rhizosphaerae]|uniref:hypothetical protein n=1 Tax=Chitinophaga rhizosphaerae TaxID=1864947 RepID=UPI000F80526E|nr:hypothetical protein [Chitinophaga rhizosphaerae]
MRQFLLTLAVAVSIPVSLSAQSNTFPATGNAGIGTTSPQAPLQIVSTGRTYVVNKFIANNSEDSQGTNYILLHPIYVGTLIQDYQVSGKISAVRGSAGSYNRKWTMEVNTSSAYNGNIGTLLCYNEPTTIVIVTYNSVKYMALEITNNYSLYYFTFTGYTTNATLTLVKDEEVTLVEPFMANYIQTPGGFKANTLIIPGSATIGTHTMATGTAKLAVEGTIAARKVKVQATGWPDFVFADDYALQPLDSVAAFVRANKHLPGIPSEAEVKKDGHDLGDMNARLLQKVEELTLYLIEMKKENADMKKRLEKLEGK